MDDIIFDWGPVHTWFAVAVEMSIGAGIAKWFYGKQSKRKSEREVYENRKIVKITQNLQRDIGLLKEVCISNSAIPKMIIKDDKIVQERMKTIKDSIVKIKDITTYSRDVIGIEVKEILEITYKDLEKLCEAINAKNYNNFYGYYNRLEEYLKNIKKKIDIKRTDQMKIDAVI